MSDIGTDRGIYEWKGAKISGLRLDISPKVDVLALCHHNGCMAAITIKSLPASLHRALKTRAAQHKRSMTQEVIEILEKSVSESRNIDIETILARQDRFRASLKFVATDKEINEFKRAGRP